MAKKFICSKFSALVFSILLFCACGWGFGQAPVTDNTSGSDKTFTVPAGVTHINIAAWGGGGGGGGASNNRTGGNGGGGGGAASGQYAVSAGNTFTYDVGSGGAGGAANGGKGGNGSLSSITSSLPVLSLIGNPGLGGLGNRGTIVSGVSSTGGSASGGTTNAAGSNGLRAGNNGPSGAGGNSGTGFSQLGTGGVAVSSESSGNPGLVPGGGGSGGYRNNNNNMPGGAGANGRVMFDFISVSSVTPSSVCVGSTITITGNYFSASGTPTVTINGTACTSVTVVNATTITAVVAAGTTSGVVEINNNLRRNNGHSITINPAPSITLQPTAVSICTNATGTFKVTATGATTYQWMRNGVNLSNDATYSGVNTPTLTITYPAAAIAGNFSVAVGNGTCSTSSSSAVLTVIPVPVPAVSPVPANGAFGVCYAGTGAVNAISWGAVAGATSYDVYFGAGSLPATVTATNVTANSYATGALLPNTTYYWRVVAKNGCGTAGSATFTFTTSDIPCVCTADIGTADPSIAYIKMVSFRGALNQAVIDNPSTYSTVTPGYQDFSNLTPRPVQAQGNGLNVFIDTYNSNSDKKASFVKVWVDWNRNGDFTDTGENIFNVTTGFVSTTIGIAIPPTTPPGNYRMRIRIKDADATINPCKTINNFGETEDYIFTVIANCSAIVTSTTDGSRCGTGPVTVSAVAVGSPTEFRWYAAPIGGSPIGTTATGTWSTPSITSTTTYYVAAFNGCESLVRIPVKAIIKQTPDITFTPGSAVACGDSSIIAISAAGDKEVDYFIDEKFEGGGLGVFTNQNILSTANNAFTMWQNRTSVFVPGGSVWFPAIASGVAGSKFVMATSDLKDVNVENALVSPVINTTNYSNLTFRFRVYFSKYRNTLDDDFVSIEASTDGGASYTEIKRIYESIGQGNDFATVTIPPAELAAYENKPSVRIRIRYKCNWGDGVAVDDVEFFGERPLQPSFVWTGTPVDIYSDAAATIPYANQPISRIYIKPSLAQLEANKSFVLSATATLVNGCSAVGNITVNNNNNISSVASADWATATAWLPGKTLPDITKCVIVKTPVTIKGNAHFEAFNVLVLPSGILNINDDPTKTASLRIQEELTNRGPATAVNVNSGGNLIQINDNAANSGSITVKRNINVSSGRKQYNFLISPVVGANLKTTIYRDGSGNPVSSPSVQYYIESTNYFGESSGAYIAGRGLAVKEPLTGNGPFYAVFEGPPVNGQVSINAVNSAPGVTTPGTTMRGHNLIGNPYPSNLDLKAFYTGNAADGHLSSTFRFWDNIGNTTYAQMGSNYSGNAYATYNAVNATGTAAATSDTAPSGKIPGQYVSVGQSFVATIINTSSKTLTFKNNLRVKEFENNPFFGRGGSAMDRYWLKMVTPGQLAVQMAVVYFAGGSNGFGPDDSFSSGGSDELYSVTDGLKIGINGRSPFAVSDRVPLGSRHYESGSYTIAIDQAEGIFANGQNIYLKDNQTGTVVNLSEGSYTFSAGAGETTGRFEIIYEPQTILATDGKVKESLQVYRDGTDFVVKSQSQEITGLEVYDSAGRMILKTAPNSMKATIDSSVMVNGVYVLKIDRHGQVTTKKVIK
ncbi:GEVED domain-containing protein [Chryseobacterium sp. R2A-55]|uniref:GEVED domain-containing protein n=1 Tax=Chryseobacterium sp. R2A-55 TaxID=2744445 RepID=UPI001F3AD513|nr:GEVED domain-containing protein [Chryseobacterium sp. R2A-55]